MARRLGVAVVALAALGGLATASDVPWYSESITQGPPCNFSLPTYLDVSPSALQSDPGVQQALALGHKLAKEAVARSGVASVSFGATFRTTELGTGSAGFANTTARSPVHPATTRYRIASQTKVFVTLAAFMMHDAGYVSLDDRVVDYVPEFALHSAFKGKQNVTLRQLATFRSGLPREACLGTARGPACGIMVGTNQSAILEATSEAAFVFPPGQRPSYSNFGIALLGHALSVAVRGRGVAEAPYSGLTDYFQRRVATPLRLKHTHFTISAADRADYALSPPSQINDFFRFADTGWSAPAGQLISSAGDMLAFARHLLTASLGSPPAGTPRLMSGAAMREYLRATTPLEDGLAAFGYAWGSVFSQGRRVLFKSGALPGYLSMTALAPDEGVAVTVLTAADGVDSSALAFPYLHAVANAVRGVVLHRALALYGGEYRLDTGAALPATLAAASEPVRTPEGLVLAFPPHAEQVGVNVTARVSATGAGLLLSVVTSSGTQTLSLVPQGSPHAFRMAPAGEDCLMAVFETDSRSKAEGNRIFGTDLIRFDVPAQGQPASAILFPASNATLSRV